MNILSADKSIQVVYCQWFILLWKFMEIKPKVEFWVNCLKNESLWQWITCIKDDRLLSRFFKQYLEVALDNTGSLFKFEIFDIKLVCKDFKNHGGWKIYLYEYKGEYYFIIILAPQTFQTLQHACIFTIVCLISGKVFFVTIIFLIFRIHIYIFCDF